MRPIGESLEENQLNELLTDLQTILADLKKNPNDVYSLGFLPEHLERIVPLLDFDLPSLNESDIFAVKSFDLSNPDSQIYFSNTIAKYIWDIAQKYNLTRTKLLIVTTYQNAILTSGVGQNPRLFAAVDDADSRITDSKEVAVTRFQVRFYRSLSDVVTGAPNSNPRTKRGTVVLTTQPSNLSGVVEDTRASSSSVLGGLPTMQAESLSAFTDDSISLRPFSVPGGSHQTTLFGLDAIPLDPSLSHGDNPESRSVPQGNFTFSSLPSPKDDLEPAIKQGWLYKLKQFFKPRTHRSDK